MNLNLINKNKRILSPNRIKKYFFQIKLRRLPLSANLTFPNPHASYLVRLRLFRNGRDRSRILRGTNLGRARANARKSKLSRDRESACRDIWYALCVSLPLGPLIDNVVQVGVEDIQLGSFRTIVRSAETERKKSQSSKRVEFHPAVSEISDLLGSAPEISVVSGSLCCVRWI